MSSKNKKNKKHKLPSVNGIDVFDLMDKIRLDIEQQKKKVPPPFTLEIGVPANNIEKQLKRQGITFEPNSIKKYDKLIKSIVDLSNEDFISQKKRQKIIYKVYERSIKHVYFIYEMI